MKRLTRSLLFALLLVASLTLPVSADGGAPPSLNAAKAKPGKGGGGVQTMCCTW